MRRTRRRKRKTKSPALSMGIELETYSIDMATHKICRKLHFPRRSAVEEGERFIRDWSIGSEYNSPVFQTICEALFLLKNGLRKYSKFRKKEVDFRHVIFPVGGWVDRFAGTHIHIGVGMKGITYREAQQLLYYLHDHIPFLIVLAANSPVWRGTLTANASSRLLLGSTTYCKVTKRDMLYKQRYREVMFNKGSKKKAPTLEVRVCDSSLPEYIVAALCVCYAVTLRWLRKKNILNKSTHTNYLKARRQAMLRGSRAKLVWSNHWMSVPRYIDLFFRKYEEELRFMDMPGEIIDVFKLLKRGWNQADVMRTAAQRYKRKYRPTWQRRFAKQYIPAIQELLDGNSYRLFAQRLGVKLPLVQRTWLGRRNTRW